MAEARRIADDREPSERLTRTSEELALSGWACAGMPIPFAILWLLMGATLQNLLAFTLVMLLFLALGIAFLTIARGLKNGRAWARRFMVLVCWTGVALVTVFLYGANAGFAALLMEYRPPHSVMISVAIFGLLSALLFGVYCVKSIRSARFWSSAEVKAICGGSDHDTT